MIEEASGTFSSTDFLDFDRVNTTAFDINYPAELTIICQTGGGGLMTLDSTSFTGLCVCVCVSVCVCVEGVIIITVTFVLGCVQVTGFPQERNRLQFACPLLSPQATTRSSAL